MVPRPSRAGPPVISHSNLGAGGVQLTLFLSRARRGVAFLQPLEIAEKRAQETESDYGGGKERFHGSQADHIVNDSHC